MKTKCYFDASGALINVGEWDLFPSLAAHRNSNDPDMRKSAEDFLATNPPIENPLPKGAYAEVREVTRTEHGLFLETDHAALRRQEYPSIGEQLDALWKGGAEAEAMKAKVAAVKAKFPKASDKSSTR